VVIAGILSTCVLLGLGLHFLVMSKHALPHDTIPGGKVFPESKTSRLAWAVLDGGGLGGSKYWRIPTTT
jgi:hypothetical protein